eukprot:Gb_23951 [translate_table: standard]
MPFGAVQKRPCLRAILCLHYSVVAFSLCNFRAAVAATGQTSGTCISPGGRFPQFSSEGKPPRKSPKGANDLTLCRIFRKKTCCSAAQTHPALISVRRLASDGEASQECLDLWELLECSICDPRVGIRPGPPVICRSFCDSVLQACSDAFFAVDPKTQVLAPCGSRDTLCGRASEWTSNGSEFCQLSGFSVLESTDLENFFCFDGKRTIEMLSDAWERASQTGSSQNVRDSSLLHEFYQWVRQMDVSESISWAVGGLVLTGGVIFMSKRGSRSYRQKRASLLRTKNMLEVRTRQQSAMNVATTKSSKGRRKS